MVQLARLAKPCRPHQDRTPRPQTRQFAYRSVASCDFHAIATKKSQRRRMSTDIGSRCIMTGESVPVVIRFFCNREAVQIACTCLDGARVMTPYAELRPVYGLDWAALGA